MIQQVEFFFDYASPWAYLANALIARKLPGSIVVRHPVYLRGFDAFSKGLPYGADKAAYLARDFTRCATHEKVPFTPPSFFPINGIHALRAAIVAEREGVMPAYHEAMFQAAWRDSRDISSKEVVMTIAREVGLVGAADGIEAPSVKSELRSLTLAAVARGVFGVPTFAVGDELFWGHDRMEYAARAASQIAPDPGLRR